MRLPSFIVGACLLALLVAPALAADNPAGENAVVRAGGLACFSIRPPDAPTNGSTGPRFPPQPAPAYRSCDQLCADKHAACTATTSSMNPPRSCASTYYDPEDALCRCCTAAH